MLKPTGWRSWLDAVASVSIIVAASSVVWMVVSIRQSASPQQPPMAKQATTVGLPAEPVSLDRIAFKGASNARVGVIQYSDFECPYCATFARDTLPRVMAAYVDTVRPLWVSGTSRWR